VAYSQTVKLLLTTVLNQGHLYVMTCSVLYNVNAVLVPQAVVVTKLTNLLPYLPWINRAVPGVQCWSLLV